MQPEFQVRPTFDQPSTERGQVLILIVFLILGLVGVIGLVVDGGGAFAEQRRAQNAADAAALAGALERVNNNSSGWVNAVYASAAQNGYNNDGVSNIVEVYSPPISGPDSGNIEYIQVRVTSNLRTYFASVIGMSQITIAAEAVSRTKTPEYMPMLGGAAIVSLAPSSDCDNQKSFWVHGEATLAMSGGGIFINSNDPNCALIVEGEGSIRINDHHPIQVVGGASIQKPKLVTPYPPITGAQAIPYPPPFYMPKVGCGNKQAAISLDGHSMTPGNWDDVFPPPGVDTLAGGVYCLNNDFIVGDNSELAGSGVVFKIEHGKVKFAGSAKLNLAAPPAGAPSASGGLGGLLLYQPIDNTNDLVLNASEGSSLRGAILAPGAIVRIKGNDSNYGFRSQIVGYRIEVDGDSNVIITYVDNQNYDALSFPELQFSQ